MSLYYKYFLNAVKNRLVFCGTINNNCLVLCRKEYIYLSEYYIKAYQKGTIKDNIYVLSEGGMISFIDITPQEARKYKNIYKIDFFNFIYQLYLSIYDGIIDDRRSLIIAHEALNGNIDDLANLFYLSPHKLRMFMEGQSEYDKEIKIKKLCNYLEVKYPITHYILLNEK